MIWVPGHSKGLACTMIKNGGDDFILLASDVGYAEKSWQEMILPGVIVDKEDARQSLAWVKKMAEDPNCITAIANHDTNVKPHIIEI